MIDLHCHVLPGIDDGPATMAEALEMCRIASVNGITTLVATPHFRPGSHTPTSLEVYKKASELQEAARREGMSLRLLCGAEITVTPELRHYLSTIEHLTINKTRRYFLAELYGPAPPRWDHFLGSLQRSGFIPILAHPERNAWFLNHYDALVDYVERGGMVQITAMSVAGLLGNNVSRYCQLLLRNRLVHVLATDAHSRDCRAPVLADAVAVAQEVVGVDAARRLVFDNPAAIVEGRPLPISERKVDPERGATQSWRATESWTK